MRTSPLGCTAFDSHASSEAFSSAAASCSQAARRRWMPMGSMACGFDLGVASRPPSRVDLADLALGRRLQGSPGTVGVGGQVGQHHGAVPIGKEAWPRRANVVQTAGGCQQLVRGLRDPLHVGVFHGAHGNRAITFAATTPCPPRP